MISLKDVINIETNKPTDMIITGPRRNTKIMFHSPGRKERNEVDPHYHKIEFENYQKEHWNSFFANTKYVLSFWYESKTAEFIGTYKLGEPLKDTVIDSRTGKERKRYQFLSMKEIDFLGDYKNRLHIFWTNSNRNYGRWIDSSKYFVHSIKPSILYSIGEVPRFYYEISLSFPKLKQMFAYSLDNANWKSFLVNRAGVYLILDKSTGEQYIGSAYGTEGFWGRWKQYADNGHGGNKMLKSKNPGNFVFSILWETIPSTQKNQIIAVESKYKEILGSRVFGLNNN
jgi:hypothetical protein